MVVDMVPVTPNGNVTVNALTKVIGKTGLRPQEYVATTRTLDEGATGLLEASRLLQMVGRVCLHESGVGLEMKIVATYV